MDPLLSQWKNVFAFERPGHIAKCLHAMVHQSVLEENDGNSDEKDIFFLHFSKNMSRKWKFSKVCLLTFSADVFFVHLLWILWNFLADEFT